MIAKFCSKCVMPSTKPFITFDKNNVCNACLSHSLKSNAKKGINWSHREQEFEILVEAAKKVKAPYYDFLVPVSGGKDSLTQIHYLLERGLRILAMTVDYGIKTEIGKTNLEIVTHKQGVDLISLRPNMILHKKTIRYGLEMYGDPDLMSHTLIHAYPLRVALNYKIPYVFLGENSAFEYGGNKKLAERKNINSEWFYSYACSNGMTPEKLAKEMGISYEKFKIYDFPFEMDSSDCNCKGVFSSYFHFWDSESNLEIAKKYGFQTSDIPIEGTYRNFVGIDELLNRLHQYLKVLKFGYGRASDHASEDIRNGRIDRDHGIDLVSKYDSQPIGQYIKSKICNFLNYKECEFELILEKYRNMEIWEKNSEGEWFIPRSFN